MTLLEAAEQAYNELSRLHEAQGPCKGVQHCPTAQALLDLMRAISDERSAVGEFKHAHQWRGEPQPTLLSFTTQDIHDVAAALLLAQGGIGQPKP